MRTATALLLIVGAVLAAACGSPASQGARPPAAPQLPAAQPGAARPAEQPPAQTNYDAPAWKELIAAARAEGKVIVASGPSPETRVKLPAAFKERFGVELEYLGGRSSDLQTRLRGERASGVYTVDAIIGGGDSVTAMYQDGWFAPIRPQMVVPELQSPTVFIDNRYPFLDPRDEYLVELEASVIGTWAVNPEVVRDGELQTYADLLNPKWKGKISVEDPTVPGQGQNNGVYVYMLKGEEYFKQLYVDQQPAISRDDRQMQDWLARGTYPITFGLSPKDVDDMLAEGLPAKDIGPLDATGWVAGGFSVLALFDNAPHPNAAKLLLNWIMSPDGMAVHAEAEGQGPTRKDVPHPWMHDYQIPKEGVSYQRLYGYQFITEQKQPIIRRIREILGQ